MIRIMAAACLLAVILPVLASAGYSELREALDGYEPPAHAFPEPAARAPNPDPRHDDEAFDAKRQELAALKQRWETRALSVDTRDLFPGLSPELTAAVKHTAHDLQAAKQLVKAGYTLETIEAMTLARNPGVKAAGKRFRAELESFTQVSRLDAILKRYTAFTEGVMTGVGSMKGKDPVKMKFPFPGTLALKGEIAAQSVEAAWEDLQIVRRNALTDIRKAFWNLVYVQRAQAITAEMVELLQHLEGVATSRYESGKTSYQDVVKVSIQREVLYEKLVTLEEGQRTVEAKLRAILDLPMEAEIGLPRETAPQRGLPELEGLYGRAAEKRQELRKLRALVGKMELMIEMGETMILPPYTLNLSLYEDEAVNRVGSTAMEAPFDTVVPAGRGAGLPKLPWYGIEDAFLRQTREKLGALKDELRMAEARTAYLVRSCWSDLDRAWREEALFANTVVGLSQTALDVATRSYESGKVAFADVTGAYTIWLEANLTLARKRSDMGIARAELEKALGTSIQ
jgi:outer membrane protein TolC